MAAFFVFRNPWNLCDHYTVFSSQIQPRHRHTDGKSESLRLPFSHISEELLVKKVRRIFLYSPPADLHQIFKGHHGVAHLQSAEHRVDAQYMTAFNRNFGGSSGGGGGGNHNNGGGGGGDGSGCGCLIAIAVVVVLVLLAMGS